MELEGFLFVRTFNTSKSSLQAIFSVINYSHAQSSINGQIMDEFDKGNIDTRLDEVADLNPC